MDKRFLAVDIGNVTVDFSPEENFAFKVYEQLKDKIGTESAMVLMQSQKQDVLRLEGTMTVDEAVNKIIKGE